MTNKGCTKGGYCRALLCTLLRKGGLRSAFGMAFPKGFVGDFAWYAGLSWTLLYLLRGKFSHWPRLVMACRVHRSMGCSPQVTSYHAMDAEVRQFAKDYRWRKLTHIADLEGQQKKGQQ